ncbi:uncharacterized protein TRAVEDRAFT_34095 [Trametes versicolor FP-101664 SS1]|uniref:uncharacterized protein n=1 Tax=Trametes versicolor (strain FP-101664) TaxID=717944 RepID=UPI0004622BB6|nr:uncharacterized protein TRAVEDRAFT_34095 [Trametes versicolor FP-101664 SS1]EIW62750.1 hypothetical protein TRAVEDRAFT_34095 [Trametes versicolor FP-101664 SS1]
MDEPPIKVTLTDMKDSLEFIRLIQEAMLDGSNLSVEVIDRIRNPPQEPLKIDDPDILYWVEVYMAVGNASEESYLAIRAATMHRFPQMKALSLYKVKKEIEKMSGVVGQIDEMCINSCIGFTGPFAAHNHCHKCGQPRYCPVKLAAGKKVPWQKFVTMLPGPQVQAVYRSEEGTDDLGWFHKAVCEIIASTPLGAPSLSKYYDLVSSTELLRLVADGTLGPHDVILMHSIDGAQLYRNKKSDCWISLWVLVSISPDKRYKKVYILPGAIIPGPKHPEVLDSFLFPGFYHISALMREGLNAYHARLQARIVSKLFLALGTADGPGMAMFEGTVGHHGNLGCRVLCGLPGRHKPGCPHYYPALLKPLGDPVPGCDHNDISLASIPLPSVQAYQRNLQLLLSARSEAQFKQLRKATGLCKPSIVSGLPRALPVPTCFPLDMMHLTCLNLPDLFLSLWRGTIQGSIESDPKTWDCAVLAGSDVWTAYGVQVKRATSYLPGFFDRASRNITEKVNSGYKVIEFMTWFYNYLPAMLRWLLPEAYWLQLCKLVRGVKILYAEDILPEELVESKELLTGAVEEYEALYYARDPDHLHIVRPCIHLVWHGPDQVILLGSVKTCTQLPTERLIGDLGCEIKQPSNPFMNLSQRALRRCQINAVKSMLPYLDRARQKLNVLPRAAKDLGDGYALLRKLDTCARTLPALEAAAFYDYLSVWEPESCEGEERETFTCKVRKWARMHVPNGTAVRSAWTEHEKPLSQLRLGRVVKARMHTDCYYIKIGDVQYFTRIGRAEQAVALVSVFRPRDEDLYQRSFKTVELHEYRGDESLCVINAKTIETGIGMIPDVMPVVDFALEFGHLHVGEKYFVADKLGFEVKVTVPGDIDLDMDVD